MAKAALAGKLPSDQRLILQSSEALLNALASPQYGRPSGLGLVFDDGIRSGQMLELKDFVDSTNSIYQQTWIPSPWSVLKWSLRQTGLIGARSYDVSGNIRTGQLVLVAALEEIFKQVLILQEEKGHSVTDRVMTREAFTGDLARLSNVKLSAQDTDVLLQYLRRDKQVLSYDLSTVKFKPTSSASPEPITPEDATIASLKTLINNLRVQVLALEDRISILLSNAQAAVKKQNKQSAISALRSKKIAERSLQQRSDTLQQLEEVYSKIEQAVDQVQIMEVMETSAGVLKGLNQQIGGVERVDAIVENLREQMMQVDEVGQVLEEPLDGKAVVDEAEVDDELAMMEREQMKAREEQEAQATKSRLQELERIEKETRAAAARGSSNQELELQSNIEGLSRMSIEEERPTDQQHKIPQPAS